MEHQAKTRSQTFFTLSTQLGTLPLSSLRLSQSYLVDNKKKEPRAGVLLK
jgi:hypothetical protein